LRYILEVKDSVITLHMAEGTTRKI